MFTLFVTWEGISFNKFGIVYLMQQEVTTFLDIWGRDIVLFLVLYAWSGVSNLNMLLKYSGNKLFTDL